MTKHSTFLFTIQVLTSFYMLGVIWFVQLVHYPIFNFFQGDSSREAHQYHSKKTSLVVVPVMILDLGSAIWLLFRPYPNLICVIILLILTALPLIVTFALQVPTHKKLDQNMEHSMIAKLIHGNWLRTILWTLKGIYVFILVWILLERISG